MKFAIIRTGGKQYLVEESQEIIVDHLKLDKKSIIEFETLAQGYDDKTVIKLGTPTLKTKVKGEIVDNFKGDKINVARFKAKTRYRKVRGFRPMLSRVKIISV